jgi:CheY-like chemotaxis protein
VLGLAPDQPTFRLLVVDDREINRRLLVRMLSSLGFALREASNGREALAVWEQWNPHLIFMDMRMPVMDGYAATRAIKATTRGQATVVVAITASALEEERQVILSEGCDDYIRKPLREEQLLAALEKHLGARFLYAEATPGAQEKAPESLLISGQSAEEEIEQHLAMLPAELIAQLHAATVVGDLDQILAAVSKIEESDPSLAAQLSSLAYGFEHERILALIRLHATANGKQEMMDRG